MAPPEPYSPPRGGVLAIFEESSWQMTQGERAALEGVLASVQPRLSIEIGTAQGGSLGRIAHHSAEVHTFDLDDSGIESEVAQLPNVTFHVGDSHRLLPELLAEFEREGRTVDFALVDGDHSPEGVRRDVRDLLDSPATDRTVLLLHDTMNEYVRSGIEASGVPGYPKVAWYDPDCLSGYLFRAGQFKHELWGGLGLIVTDSRRPRYFAGSVVEDRAYSIHPLLLALRERLEREDGQPAHDAPGELLAELDERKTQLDALAAELAELRWRYEVIANSRSWRMTAPLRRLAAGARAGRELTPRDRSVQCSKSP